MRYIWKVKAYPDHFEEKCYNPDRKKNHNFKHIKKELTKM